MIFPVRNKADETSPEPVGIGLLKLISTLTIVLPALIFAVAAVISYGAHERDARVRVEGRADLAYQHARRVFATFDLAAAQAEELLLDKSDDDIRRDDADLSARIARLSSGMPEVEDIWVLDASGHPLLTGAMTPAPVKLNFWDRDYFQAQLTPGIGTYVSERLIGRLRPSQIFELSYRRRAPNDAFVGIIGVSGDPRYFERFYGPMLDDELTAIALLRDDGSILARVPPVSAPVRMPAGSGFLRARADAPRLGVYTDVSAVDGVERIVAYRALDRLPVYVVAATDVSRIRAQWRSDMARHLYFGLPATLALFFVSLGAIRQARRQAETLQALRREAERRAFAEEALRQANKMEAIGRLTGGVAHDFNNLLQVMLGRLARIQKAAAQNAAPTERDMDAMGFAIDRAATLTHRLLAFSRQQPLRVDVVDINRLVSGMAELIRQTAGNEIFVETKFAGGLWPVAIDANQLENAILNITSNARDAMGGSGRIAIETANSVLDEAYAASNTEVTPGQYVCVSLSDTGHGIPQEMIAKIFEPFFTTKPVGQGTGLGLSMVYGFVHQSGGHVAIQSEEGQGTMVRLYLPRHVGATSGETASDGPAVPAEVTGSGLILVVEDELEVRRLIIDTLTDIGYMVVAGANAAEGLRLLDQHPDICLLLTDVGLPDSMNGRQLADAVRMHRPDLPVVFMTGYARTAVVHHGRVDAGVDLLTKPFTRASLSQKIRDVLAQRRAEQDAHV